MPLVKIRLITDFTFIFCSLTSAITISLISQVLASSILLEQGDWKDRHVNTKYKLRFFEMSQNITTESLNEEWATISPKQAQSLCKYSFLEYEPQENIQRMPFFRKFPSIALLVHCPNYFGHMNTTVCECVKVIKCLQQWISTDFPCFPYIKEDFIHN